MFAVRQLLGKQFDCSGYDMDIGERVLAGIVNMNFHTLLTLNIPHMAVHVRRPSLLYGNV